MNIMHAINLPPFLNTWTRSLLNNWMTTSQKDKKKFKKLKKNTRQKKLMRLKF